MKKISDFDVVCSENQGTKGTSTSEASIHKTERLDSLDGLLSQTSMDSFRKFRDCLLDKLRHSADKELSTSIECPSNISEVFSVYKGLESEAKSWNLDKMIDQKGVPINFVDLFIHRYKQVCKDRQRVRESDLRQFTRMLEQTTTTRKNLKG